MSHAHHDGFRVASTVAVLFSRLPVRLRDHIAFRHFFTPELDPSANGVCIKLFTLMIFYFAAVFRLEGRRRHYLEHNTPSSGWEFYAAHRRAQRIFKDITTCYGIVLSRYNIHSTLHYKVSHAFLIRGRRERGPYAVGLREDASLLTSSVAFPYPADEMLFYEHLFQTMTDVVRLAFSEDAKVQDAVTKQLGVIFRSPTFTFNDLRRSERVSAMTRELEGKSLSLMENTHQLAELLAPSQPKMVAKYAVQQRSPFVANFLPGGNTFMKYQRPRNNAFAKPQPTKNELLYTVETKLSPFPIEHRAMARMREFNERREQRKQAAAERKDGGQRTTSAGSNPPHVPKLLPQLRATGLTPEPITVAGSRPPSRAADQPHLRTLSSSDPAGRISSMNAWRLPSAATDVGEMSQQWGGSMSVASKTLGSMPNRAAGKSPVNATSATTQQIREEREAAFHSILDTPLTDWSTHVSVAGEVEALFQAVVNGVPIGDLSVPKDILLVYDDTGILQIARDGEPLAA